MKKLIIIMIVISSSILYGRGHHFHHHHHCHGRWIGPAIVGGLVGSALINSYRSPTVVYAQPTYIQPTVVPTQTSITYPTVITQPQSSITYSQPRIHRVWVEGRYVDRIDVNGNVVRIWEPGYYKEVIVNNLLIQ